MVPVGDVISRMIKAGASKRKGVHVSFTVNLTELGSSPVFSKVNVYWSSAGSITQLKSEMALSSWLLINIRL